MCVKLDIKSLVSGSKHAVYFGSNAEWLGNPQALPRSNEGTHGAHSMQGEAYSNSKCNHVLPDFYSSTKAVERISGFTHVTKETAPKRGIYPQSGKYGFPFRAWQITIVNSSKVTCLTGLVQETLEFMQLLKQVYHRVRESL